MEETIKQKLLKIKALAERGIEGEKENAERLLNKLLKEYNVSIDELTDSELSFYQYAYKNNLERVLLTQTILYVHKTSKVTHYRQNKKCMAFKQTFLQHLETMELYSIYRKAFEKEIGFLLTAFVTKHGLFSGEETKGAADISREDLLRMMAMIEGMKTIKKPVKRNLLTH